MNEKLVLVVEDMEVIRVLLVSQLQCFLDGFEVLTASDGEIGWEMIKEHQPVLVISDNHMPKKEGVQLFRDVTENFPETKFILMSGNLTKDEALALGIEHFLQKPFDIIQLVEEVGKLLSLQKWFG